MFHTRYKCVLFFDFGLIGIQSISSIVLISLTAKLAITGDWGRPQQAGLQIRTEGRMLQMLHLYIQMPCLPVCYTWNKSVISEFALMNSEKSLVFIENSLKKKTMIISYDNLWKLLIDKRLNKTELAKKTKISTSTITKMSRGEPVALTVLVRICDYLNCDIGDIVSVRRD